MNLFRLDPFIEDIIDYFDYVSLNNLQKAIPEFAQKCQLPYFQSRIYQIRSKILLKWLSNKRVLAPPPVLDKLLSRSHLNLSFKEISVIPPEIGTLKNKVLSLNVNNISIIPPEIGQIQSLRELWLDDNQITVIPPEIGQLKNLRILNLSKNQISIIPPEVCQLQSLTILDLSHNQISTIPHEIIQCRSLQELSLYGNPITIIPDGITRCSSLNKIIVYKGQLKTFGVLWFKGIIKFQYKNEDFYYRRIRAC